MSEQEAQQAQTIARIKRQKYFQTTRGAAVNLLVRDKDDLLEIVDSQAQKIASLEAMAEINRNTLETAKSLIESKTAEIAEVRKLAEKMRDASERPGGEHTFLPWEVKP